VKTAPSAIRFIQLIEKAQADLIVDCCSITVMAREDIITAPQSRPGDHDPDLIHHAHA